MNRLFNSIIVFSLLFALPMALRGQANLPQYQGSDWQTLLVSGGVLRIDDCFVRLDEGVGSLVSMDFVNGFAVGPKATFGKVLGDYSRIEIDENVKWACSRRQLMARGALRYVFAPQYFGFYEVFGGKMTTDFDRYPVMDDSQRSLAASLFGWSHFKLYEQTTFGTRLYGALAPDVQLSALVAWERREQMENHRPTNIFGRHAKDNKPLVKGEKIGDFGIDKLWRVDWQIDYVRGRTIVVSDDMNTVSQSAHPTFSLRGTSGFGHGLRFLSLEAMVAGRCSGWAERQKIVYQASAGFFPVRNNVLLMDMHHFDASSFVLQRIPDVALFSLLDNYELSTSKPWVEAHAELNHLYYYAQVHSVKVTGSPIHNELSGGISLSDQMRVGATIGVDDLRFDGVAFNLVLKM